MKDKYGFETLESMSQAVWYNMWVLKKFSQYLKGNVLEVGCGVGNFTKYLVNYGRVTAIDINKNYIDKLNQDLGKVAQVGFGDIESGEYFFGQQKFDCIVCLNVLEHIKNDKSALENLYLLLKENGILILVVPAHKILFGEVDKAIGHFRRYSKEEIENIEELCSFSIIKNEIFNFLGAIGWLINTKIFKKKTIEEGSIKIFNLIAPTVLLVEKVIKPFFGTSILIISRKNL